MIKTKIPLLIPLGALIAGILSSKYCKLELFQLSILMVTLLLLYLINQNKFLKSSFIPILFLGLGIFSSIVNNHLNNPRHFSNLKGDSLVIEIKKKEETQKGFRYFAAVRSINHENKSIKSFGNVMMYTDSLTKLQVHTFYKIPFYFKEIERFQNPGMFDYGTYLSHLNVFHTTYLRTTPEQIPSRISLMKFIYEQRINISEFYNQQFKNETSSEIINTLLLGEKKAMNNETKDIFINNGLAHLLAISGMHVGIVLIILRFVFGQISSLILKNLMIIIGIWFYILLSGMQIPAIRAGFMFSMMVIGQMSNRNIKVLNSVLFAAMVLLAVNPKMLYQLSFQLSFTAMASIIIFYPRIYQLLKFRHVILVKLWQLISLNISVQIMVLPLSIYYFKQLPTYSILSSLISIPFMIVIMWGAVALLFSAKISLVINKLITFLLDHLIECYLSILDFFSNLPYSLIQEIELHGIQVVLWVTAILGFTFYYFKRSSKVNLACMCFTPLLFISSFINLDKETASKIIVYDEANQIIIDLIDHKKKLRYMENPNKKSYQVNEKQDHKIKVISQNEVIQWKGKSVAILNHPPISFYDLCILNDESINLSKNMPCTKVIIPRKINVETQKQNTYSIKNKGSFILKF